MAQTVAREVVSRSAKLRRRGLAVLAGACAAALVLAACGGDDDDSSGAEPPPEPVAATPIEPKELVDISTIDESEAEVWARAADTWADGALDDANTIGEFLGVERNRNRLLKGKALQIRGQIEGALASLDERCLALSDDVEEPPAEFAEAAQNLALACDHFATASKQLKSALEEGKKGKMTKGIKQLANGVNAIATTYESISPSLG